MNRVNWDMLLAVLFFTGITSTSNAVNKMSPQLQLHVMQEMTSHVISPEDREYIQHEWSDARKVAEFICRPSALETLRKGPPKADKVFLGDGHNGGLTLHSSIRLTGTGQYRSHGTEWEKFNFTCELSPLTGEVTDFRYYPVTEKTG
ncbi:hypothetical protein M8Q70_003545 [Salmonella enterica]|nr:hypothetical protein [Salmonella enterica]EAO4224388.1 hypothetical protein [Salmonella enterica]EAR9571306.1 hypothetical protein [Salmonella enterica]EAT6445012.1 hypothetical protein [Salmonella enterica]EGB2528823.1 DUF930 domain-containing protein [Salmonella enterica]